jgi:hypothetical protein
VRVAAFGPAAINESSTESSTSTDTSTEDEERALPIGRSRPTRVDRHEIERQTICEEWLKDLTINPRTKRQIKVGGPVYKKLQQECRIKDPAPAPSSSRINPQHDNQDISVCEKWLKDPSINPRTNRKIKVGGPIYKKLEVECVTISPAVRVPGDVCASVSIRVLNLPTTSVTASMNLTISANNLDRVSRNTYLKTLNFLELPKMTSEDYFKKYGKSFRKTDPSTIQASFNKIIKYVPNFVFTFDNGVVEPYIEIPMASVELDEAMLFDLAMIQAVVNQHSEKNVKVRNLKLCILRCSNVVNDLIKINRTPYYRPPSDYRLCLTPDSYSISSSLSREDFLGNLLQSSTFNTSVTNNRELMQTIRRIQSTNLYLNYDNADMKKLLRILGNRREQPDLRSNVVNNIFQFPLSIQSDIVYFNVTSVFKKKSLEMDRRIRMFENFLKHSGNGFRLESGRDVERMGFEKLPFNLLFHKDCNPSYITIDPDFVEGPYTVLYNRHKKFENLKTLVFSSVRSSVDQTFIDMLQDNDNAIDFIFNSSPISNIEQLNLYDIDELQVNDHDPNFIFKARINSLNALFITPDSPELSSVDESSSVDLGLMENFYNHLHTHWINTDGLGDMILDLNIERFQNVNWPENFAFLRGNWKFNLKIVT